MNKDTNAKNAVALELKDVIKIYGQGDNSVKALDGVNLKFRKSEFVSILGPSGCGKTTLLNIIGGLDRYTNGDLLINGVSTKEYKSRDWDAYRNNSIGFVFQTYNLIPHQTVLSNVELSLTLSGVSRRERTARAKAVLEKVGLKNQIHKRPNQLSGGQMQRVAIARALINNPDIILADEPTGALDTETSIQVMDILKEVAKDRLVIMVTHNPELAEKYSTRIIKMLDAKIVGDSMPVLDDEIVANEPIVVKKKGKKKKPSMSFWTAFKLSLKNLFTKKGRTILTSFAGSIGIIGIALILSVSQGMTAYINAVQEDTLTTFPLTIESSVVDMSELIETILKADSTEITHEKDAVYKNALIGELVNKLADMDVSENDLTSFKAYLEEQVKDENSPLSTAVSGIQYSYNLNLNVYTKNTDGTIIKSDTEEFMTEMIADYMMRVMGNGGEVGGEQSGSLTGGNSPMSMFMPSMNNMSLWKELLPGLEEGQMINDSIFDQYELIDNGSWPNEYDEIVLIVDENNELDDLTLYALGLMSREDIDNIIKAAASGNKLEETKTKWSYEDIKAKEYTCILPAQCYTDLDGDGVFTDMSKINRAITGSKFLTCTI